MSDMGRPAQACSRYRAVFLLALLCLTLAGCGKKPGHVDPPIDVTEDHFPRVYPDPATDPKP
jgi:predicted small lipoprotein YifL